MTGILYNIVITGKFIDGTNPADVVAAFSAKFKLPLDKAQAAIEGAPKVIKAGVDEDTAKIYLATLEKIGLVCTADPIDAASPSESVSPEAPQQQASHVAAATQSASEPSSSESSPSVYEPENPRGLSFRIEGKPDYSFLTVNIPADETLKVEASAMATMDTNIKMKTKMRGGFGRFLTGENIFINDFTAENVPGEIGIAPGTPGDLTHRYLDGDTIFLQNSAYVASTVDVSVETKWQGLVKGFFSGESLFLIRCSGKGDLWFNTYGAIIEVDVNGGYVVDTGNIVAFTEGLEYNVTKVGGYKSLFFSGEGFVCRFSGSGKVWIQTRSASAFTHWAHLYRPVKKK